MKDFESPDHQTVKLTRSTEPIESGFAVLDELTSDTVRVVDPSCPPSEAVFSVAPGSTRPSNAAFILAGYNLMRAAMCGAGEEILPPPPAVGRHGEIHLSMPTAELAVEGLARIVERMEETGSRGYHPQAATLLSVLANVITPARNPVQ